MDASADIDPSVDLLGKSASDLQDGISIVGGVISGTLNYVTGYTGFSGDVSEQSGNYLALRIDTDDNVDSITVELIGGTVGHPVTLDSDRLIVIRITDTDNQSIKVVVNKNGLSQSKTYELTGLTLGV